MSATRVLSMVLALAMVFTLFAAFPMGAGAASMADATFFAKLNYSANPGLSAVKAAVDKSDYASAKAELLKYFKNRHNEGKITGFGVSEADEFYGMAVLPMRNILTGPNEFDMWQGEFTVKSSAFAEYSVDVTERIAQELNNGAVSFMLFAGDKQQYPVYVQSKEAGAAPRLEITYEINGAQNAVTVIADNDTYISSGNTGTSYGAETQLVIKEDGSGSSPTGTDTRRTYINFPLTAAANSTIVSAKLVVSAAYAADCTTGDKDVLVINSGNTMWDENNYTWGGISHSIYSYQDADVPTWAAGAPNRDGEYDNVTSRFWFGKPMAYEYLSYLENPEAYNASHPYSDVYPGAEFGPKLVELMNAFATQMNYGYTRTLETGERLNRWVDIVDAFLGTDVFDTRLDEFVNILSFMWGDCNYLSGLDISNGSYWWSNWRIVANAGFFKAVEFLPEFNEHDAWRAKVEGNVEYTLDLLYNDDMSFTEAGPSYNAWCVKLFGDCIRAAEMSGNPMSDEFLGKVRYAARNALESYYPDGYDSNIGDSNYRDQMAYFENLNKAFNGKDSIIHAYVTGNGDGAEYLSSFYKPVNSAYMRNSWNPNETVYVNFTNNPADGHYHPDSNQVLMYAYGQPLLVDSGRYGYTGSDIYTQLRYASAHNTIEAVGVSMGNHSSSATANTMESTTNDKFDFASNEQHGYSGVSHTRNVFYSRSGYAIVTDYVDGANASQQYRQNWHFMPSSNAAASGKTAKTDFYKKANVIVANADTDAAILDGYHSADYGLAAKSEYASYSKTGEDVKFDTVLYPVAAGNSADIAVADLAAGDVSKAAIQISGAVDGYYYVKNTASSDGAFGAYSTDAKMAFVSGGEYSLAGGTTLEADGKAIVSSPALISSINLSVKDGVLSVDGENLAAAKDEASAIKINLDGVTGVMLNGEALELKTNADGAVISVASANASGNVIADGKAYNFVDNINLIPNPSFEEGTTGWTTSNYTSNMVEGQNNIAIVTSPVSDGEKALKMNVNAGSGAAGSMSTKFAITPGTTYYFACDIIHADGTDSTGFLELMNDSGTSQRHFAGANPGHTWSGSGEYFASSGSSLTNWKTVEYVFTAGANETQMGVKVGWSGNPIYLDNFKLYAIEAVENVYDEPCTITVNYVDESGNVIASPDPNGAEAAEGTIYTASVPATITFEGKVYVFDSAKSNITTKIAKGENSVTAVYGKTTDSDVSVSYVDENGSEFKADKVYVTYGTAIDETQVSFEKTILTDTKYYTFKSADGLGVVSDGTPKAVTLHYEGFDVVTTEMGISRGDSIRNDSGYTNMSSESDSTYTSRLMIDDRWYKRAGVFGVDVDGEFISVTVKFHINGSGSTSGPFNLLDVTDTLGSNWTRGNVSGLDLSGAAVATGAVDGAYVTYDITELVKNGSSEFGLTYAGNGSYVIFDSENTSNPPVVYVTKIKDKTVTSITPPADVEVAYAKTPVMPSTVKAVVDGAETELNILSLSPAEIDSRTAGTTPVTATVEIPEKYVLADGVSAQVQFNVTVLPEPEAAVYTPFGVDTKSAAAGQNTAGIYKFGGSVTRTATIDFDLTVNRVVNTLVGINNSANMTASNYFGGSSVFMLITGGNLTVSNGSGAGARVDNTSCSVSAGDTFHVSITTDVEADTFSAVVTNADGEAVINVSDYRYRTDADALDCLVLVDNNGDANAVDVNNLVVTSSSFEPDAAVNTGSSLRIITAEDGTVTLGLAFTAEISGNVNLVEGAGFEYGAADKDESGNYVVENLGATKEFGKISTDSFRLVIRGISNANSVRTYSARPYIVIGGEKIYGGAVSNTLYGAIVESIVGGTGTFISAERLKAANTVIGYVGYNKAPKEKFPLYAVYADALFDENGQIKEEYAKLGISLDPASQQDLITVILETVDLEFVPEEIEETDYSSDITLFLDFDAVM